MARRPANAGRTKPERVGAVIENFLRTSGLAPRVTQAAVIAGLAESRRPAGRCA